MSISGKQNPERAQYFVDLHNRWRESGLSQTEFCRNEGINLNTFNCWKLAIERNRVDLAAAARTHNAGKKGSRKKEKTRASDRGIKSDKLDFRPVKIKGAKAVLREAKKGALSKRQFWQEMVGLRRDSKLSTAEFCEKHGINRNKLYYWSSRILRESDVSDVNNVRGTSIDSVPKKLEGTHGRPIEGAVRDTNTNCKVVAEIFHERTATTLRIFGDQPETVAVVLQTFLRQ